MLKSCVNYIYHSFLEEYCTLYPSRMHAAGSSDRIILNDDNFDIIINNFSLRDFHCSGVPSEKGSLCPLYHQILL